MYLVQKTQPPFVCMVNYRLVPIHAAIKCKKIFCFKFSHCFCAKHKINQRAQNTKNIREQQNKTNQGIFLDFRSNQAFISPWFELKS